MPNFAYAVPARFAVDFSRMYDRKGYCSRSAIISQKYMLLACSQWAWWSSSGEVLR